MENLIQILQRLTQFYEWIPPSHKPEVSRITRDRLRTLFFNLMARCPEVYSQPDQPIPHQLLLAFQTLNISIHRAFQTEQIGSFLDSS